MSIASSIRSFNAGEWTKLLDGRSDLEKYNNASRTLENYIPSPQGGAFRRPGTEYLGTCKYANKQARTIGFNFSTSTRFIIEMGDLYLRFWTNGTRVEDPLNPGAALEVVSPYLESELREVQFIQINDVMYFTHTQHPPYKLIRVADDNWTFAEVVWDWPPFLEENITATTVTASATTSNITLTASTGIFSPLNVGGYFQIATVRETTSVQQDLTVTGPANTSALDVFGGWQLTTGGNWAGTLKVQRSYDNGSTYETIRTYNNATVGMRNLSISGDEDKQCKLRLAWTRSAAGSAAPTAVLEALENLFYGFVKITGQTSSTVVSATVISPLFDTNATIHWSEGAFSGYRGYPRTVVLYDGRVIYAGTSYKPQSLWGSFIDDFQNFRLGTGDDSGFFFTLSSDQSNPIMWLLAQRVLDIGTAAGEWTMQSSDSNSTITPTNVQATRQTKYGSKNLRALLANDVVLFIQRQGRKVREQTYSLQQEQFVSTDLTILAEHITASEIVEIAFQQQQDSIFWAIRGDGQLIGMTYERDQNVIGWHRHVTQGTFESVAVIYGGVSLPDEVWFVVKRTVGGQDVRYMERFNVGWRQTLDDEDKPNWWYVDCGVRQDSGSPVTQFPYAPTLPNISHLEGLTVSVLGDGSVETTQAVVGGAITIANASSTIIAGLPFTSTLLPMKLEQVLQDGTSKGRRKQICEFVVSVYKSLGGEFATGAAVGYDLQWFPLKLRQMSNPLDDSPPPFTGDETITAGGTTDMNGDLTIRQMQPLPLTILALVPVWNVDSR